MHFTNKRESQKKEQQKHKKGYSGARSSRKSEGYYDEDEVRHAKYACNDRETRQSMNRKIRRKLRQAMDAEDFSAW